MIRIRATLWLCSSWHIPRNAEKQMKNVEAAVKGPRLEDAAETFGSSRWSRKLHFWTDYTRLPPLKREGFFSVACVGVRLWGFHNMEV